MLTFVVILACTVAIAAEGRAQGSWDAILFVTPFPSPYLSDWEVNPNISQFTLINGSGREQDVVLRYEVHNQAGVVVTSGRSDPEFIEPDVPVVFTSFTDIAGITQNDPATEDLIERSGRLPEGDYVACVFAVDLGGFVLAEACEEFTIVYPDPPMLISPTDREVVVTEAPVFEWMPLQIPSEFDLQYLLQIAAIQPNQTPLSALTSNIPHYENLDVGATSLPYPVEALELESGTTYVWRVLAIDQNGYAASANDGSSEIWTFTFDDGTGPTPGSHAVTLSLANSFDEAGDGGTPPSDRESEFTLSQACEETLSGTDFRLGVSSPFGFKGFRGSPATLYRNDDSEWWLLTQNTTLNREVLLYGNCTGPLGGLKWLASKKIGRKQSLNEWLDTHTMVAPRIESLDYGVFILALEASTVSAPPEFREGSEFLDGREIDVLRGLNGLAVLNLREYALWQAFERLGYQEKQVELQGFVGFDASWAVSVTGAAGGGETDGTVDLTRQRTFLTLRAALPVREPIGPLGRIIESMRLGVEFEVQDSTGWSAGVSKPDSGDAAGVGTEAYSFELIPRITHTMTLREDLFPRIEGSRDLVGFVGLDFASETEQSLNDKAKQVWMQLQRKQGRGAAGLRSVGQWFGADPDAVVCADATTTKKVDYILGYQLDGDIVLGSVVLSEPALEIHVQASEDGQAVSGSDRDLSFALAMTIRGAEWDRGIAAGISVERSGPDAEPETTCSPRPRSNAITGPDTSSTPVTRPRSNAIGGASDTTSTSAASGQTNQSQWKFNWRLATEGMPIMELLRSALGLVSTLRDALTR